MAGALLVSIASAAHAQKISQFPNESGTSALLGDAVLTESTLCPLAGGAPGNCRTTIQQILNTAGSTQYAPLLGAAIVNGSLTGTVVTAAMVTPTGGSLQTLADALAAGGGGCSADCSFTGTTTLTNPLTPLNIVVGATTGTPTVVTGINITPTNWSIQGSAGRDCAVCIGSGTGNTRGFNYGIRIGDDNGAIPVISTGSLIQNAFNGSTVAVGIDFGWTTFSTALLRTPPTWINRSQLNDALFQVTELGSDGTNVNQLVLSASPTGVASALSVAGNDTNISLNLVPKGTGVIQAGGVAGVSCLANTVVLTTLVVTKGIVTHC